MSYQKSALERAQEALSTSELPVPKDVRIQIDQAIVELDQNSKFRGELISLRLLIADKERSLETLKSELSELSLLCALQKGSLERLEASASGLEESVSTLRLELERVKGSMLKSFWQNMAMFLTIVALATTVATALIMYFTPGEVPPK